MVVVVGLGGICGGCGERRGEGGVLGVVGGGMRGLIAKGGGHVVV